MKTIIRIILAIIATILAWCYITSAQPLPQPIAVKPWYQDKDGDGYGNINVSVSKKKQPIGYLANWDDCNDDVAEIHPGAPEVLNNRDDNCNGQIDEGFKSQISITTTSVKIPADMTSAGMTDAFINNSPTDATYVNKLKATNFNSYISNEGHFARWFHPFSQIAGQKGNGYNPRKGAQCGILQNELCTSYSRDFYASFDTFVKLVGGRAVLMANIQEGPITDLYYQIDKLKAHQSSFTVMYGQEGASENYPLLTASQYAAKFYSWRDSVANNYPNLSIYHVADISELNMKNGKYSAWVQPFLDYRKPDSTKMGLRQYSHFFDLGTINNTVADSAAYTSVIRSALPNQAAVINSAFKGCAVFFSQFSTGVPGYAIPKNGNTVAVAGRFIDVCYYARAQKVWMDLKAEGKLNFIGCNIIGFKGMLQALDCQWLTVNNKLYTQPATWCKVTHTLGAQVDVICVNSGSTYKIVVQNRSGNPIPIPTIVSINGKLMVPNFVNGNGRYVSTLTGTSATEYNASQSGQYANFSINYSEINL